jgi:hypothetical protein
VLVVHAGSRVDAPDRPVPRFPASRVEAVAQRLGDVLDRLRPEAVVTAAAAGADLLLLEEAQARNIPVRIVLPFGRDRFRHESVGGLGDRWTDAYDRVLARAVEDPRSSIEELELTADDDGYRLGNQALLDRAIALAGDQVVALAVRPPAGERVTTVTAAFDSRAKTARLQVIEVDPSG